MPLRFPKRHPIIEKRYSLIPRKGSLSVIVTLEERVATLLCFISIYLFLGKLVLCPSPLPWLSLSLVSHFVSFCFGLELFWNILRFITPMLGLMFEHACVSLVISLAHCESGRLVAQAPRPDDSINGTSSICPNSSIMVATEILK